MITSGNGIARLLLTIVPAFAEFERDRIGASVSMGFGIGVVSSAAVCVRHTGLMHQTPQAAERVAGSTAVGLAIGDLIGSLAPQGETSPIE